MSENILDIAHIHLSTATFQVHVSDLKKYEVLFNSEGKLDQDNNLEISKQWTAELKFPDFVISVSPKWKESYLSVWVTDEYDLYELAAWLKTFE